jgi:hypothetical protein
VLRSRVILIPWPVSQRNRHSSWRQVDGVLLGAVVSRRWVRYVLFSLLLQFIRQRCLCGWDLAVLSGRHDTPQRSAVEHQHGGAALQPRVSALTLPVTVARFAQRYIAVGVIVTQGCGRKRIACHLKANST